MEYGINDVKFDIPVVMFIFKREKKATMIVDRLSKVRPQKLYLIGDGPRDTNEEVAVRQCRKIVESHVVWDCEVIKNYAKINRGVYENIAGGAKWVFEREKWAIFLEDDNLPELSFFPFCKELLQLYEKDMRILWICGTNYMKEWKFPGNTSYTFSQNMMPCGWASWGAKFDKFYDGDLLLWEDPVVNKLVRALPYDKRLKAQDIRNWDRELRRKKKGLKFDSWDYQMSFSLRVNGLYGIVPKYNQICNIGVDSYSIHGGTNFNNVMTKRFCGLPTKNIEFPLRNPACVLSDPRFEQKLTHIILLPFRERLRTKVSQTMKKLFKMDPDVGFISTLKARFRIS